MVRVWERVRSFHCHGRWQRAEGRGQRAEGRFCNHGRRWPQAWHDETATFLDAACRHRCWLRWVAAGVFEAVKGFRRLKGCGDMPTLVAALRARHQQLGLTKAEEKVA